MKKVAVIFIFLLFAFPALAQDTLDLSKTHITADGLLMFRYPAEWVFLDGEEKHPGEAYTDDDVSGLTLVVGVVSDTTMEEVIAGFAADSPALAQEAFTLDGREAVRFESSLFRGIRDYRYAITLGGGSYGTLWLVDQNEEFETLEPTLLAILESIQSGSSASTGIKLDTTIVSYSQSFTVHYPSSLLQATASERTPNNITMTNNFGIFTADGIQMKSGDVLLVVDFGDAAALGAPANADLQAVAEYFHDSSRRTPTPIEPFASARYQGFMYDSSDSSSLFFHNVFTEVDDGQFASYLLLTTSQDDQAAMMPVLTAIIDSFELGAVIESAAPVSATFPETYVRESDGFTMPYPTGWRVETGIVGSTEFVLVTKGHIFDLSAPPEPGKPSAVVAYGLIGDLTGMPLSMLDPDTSAARVVQTITGASPDDIDSIEFAGLKSAMIVQQDPNFDNWFVAIMLDEEHFIAANMFTAPGEDQDFLGTLVDMMTMARFGDLPPLELPKAG